jgi:hypothetical protein
MESLIGTQGDDRENYDSIISPAEQNIENNYESNEIIESVGESEPYNEGQNHYYLYMIKLPRDK